MQQLHRPDQFGEESQLFGDDDCDVQNIEPSVGQVVESVERSYQMWTQWSLDLMESIAEVDRREIYALDGLSSTAEWVSNRLGMGYMSSLKLVEVAVALEQLPKIAEAYAQGRISYDHLRALVEVAGPDNEDDLLEETEGRTVAETFRMVANIKEVSAEDSRLARAGRWLETRWDHEQRQLCLYAQLPEDQGAKVEKAIDALAKRMPDDPLFEAGFTPMGVKRADALCELAGSSLADHPSKPLLVVHVDIETLTTGKGNARIEGGPTISPQTVRRLACDSIVQAMVEGKEGELLAAARRRRTVDPKIRPHLQDRDQTCRWPGCNRRQGLAAHHIVPWPKVEKTELDNLVLFCATHHYLVEEGGFKIRGDPPNIWIERPDQTPIKIGPPRLTEEAAEYFEWEKKISRASPMAPG